MIQATVTGNIGKSATIRQAGNDNVCSFSIASNKKVKGEDVTTWIDASLFGARGEKLVQYLTKGTKVVAVGELSRREHEGKTYLSLRVSELDFMGGKREGGERAPREDKPLLANYPGADYGSHGEDDAPF